MTTSQELQLLGLADALDSLAKHAARMEPDEWHPLCLECAVSMSLMRVVVHGRHIADLERGGPR